MLLQIPVISLCYTEWISQLRASPGCGWVVVVGGGTARPSHTDCWLCIETGSRTGRSRWAGTQHTHRDISVSNNVLFNRRHHWWCKWTIFTPYHGHKRKTFFFEAEQKMKVHQTTRQPSPGKVRHGFTTWRLIVSSLQFAFVILATCERVWACTLYLSIHSGQPIAC